MFPASFTVHANVFLQSGNLLNICQIFDSLPFHGKCYHSDVFLHDFIICQGLIKGYCGGKKTLWEHFPNGHNAEFDLDMIAESGDMSISMVQERKLGTP